jgi:hypothetical protein
VDYRLGIKVVGLLLVGTVLVGAASAQGIQASRAANDCPPAATPIDAAQLQIPRPLKRCDPGTPVRAFGDRVSVRIPRAGRGICSITLRGHYGYRLCVQTGNGLLYALVAKRRVRAVCAGNGAIAASQLRRPLPRETCDLVGRVVRYHGAGVHVPRSGTTCGVADTTTSEIQLCVTADKLAFYAQSRTSTDGSGPRP